jgi:hypothetical protein
MENPNRRIRQRVETLGAGPEKISPSLRGLEIRNGPVAGEVFFLDFSFYRTSQDLAPLRGKTHTAFLTPIRVSTTCKECQFQVEQEAGTFLNV